MRDITWKCRKEVEDNRSKKLRLQRGACKKFTGVITVKLERKKMTGITTVEMAYIMPVVLLVFLMIVYATFYYHDKHVLSGMAYETAVIGAQKERLPKGMNEGELLGFFREHTAGKLILLHNASATITKNSDYVVVKATASRRRMRLNVEMKALIMNPEKEIRTIRKIRS